MGSSHDHYILSTTKAPSDLCTLFILRRPGHDWPLLLAANRDEVRHRPAEPPARHWPDRPGVVAALDRTGGGSWLGVNDQALVAAVMDRKDSLGPLPGKRRRCELELEALEHAEARACGRHPGRPRPEDPPVGKIVLQCCLSCGKVQIPFPPTFHPLFSYDITLYALVLV